MSTAKWNSWFFIWLTAQFIALMGLIILISSPRTLSHPTRLLCFMDGGALIDQRYSHYDRSKSLLYTSFWTFMRLLLHLLSLLQNPPLTSPLSIPFLSRKQSHHSCQIKTVFKKKWIASKNIFSSSSPTKYLTGV